MTNYKQETPMIINNINTLKEVFNIRKILSYPERFEISFSQLEDEENRFYTQYLVKLSEECGCETGKFFISLAVLLYFAFSLSTSIIFPFENYGLNCLFYAVFGAFIGKSFSLIYSNIKINVAINKIEAKLKVNK